eukprot:TRINITY_DN6831_c0_g1_i1.p1 TRINITY_DN6831_c0_g1~~TRINITY_DN6831_c0_g1_i1.p1  ORF type:complete len:585 (-),score=126.07 TRINITY_DN6831_c0_g1_i1:129-1883(-)
MGAGASVELQQAVGNATPDEIGAAFAELPPDLQEKMKAAFVEPPTLEFRKGQDVECRMEGEEWCAGKVVAVMTLEGRVVVMVKRKQDFMPHEFHEVRALVLPPAPVVTAVVETLDSKAATRAKAAASARFVVSNPGKLHEIYNLDRRKLGEGAFASVFKAEEKATGKRVAIKSIDKSFTKNLDRLRQEVDIQASLDHPNICKLYETFEDHKKMYLVMELLEGAELFDRIIDAGHFKEFQAAVLIKQAFQAELHMNEQGVCHRDLKPENFMFIDRSPIEKNTMKLVDFGLASKCAEGQVLKTKAGTPYYVAPEVLAGSYDMRSDMWSLGVILFILMCGYPPFFGESDAEVLSKVRAGKFTFHKGDWKHASDDCKELITMCLKMNPHERFTPGQALKHGWLSSMEKLESIPADATFLTRFQQFRSSSQFQKVARQAIAMRAKEPDIKRMRELFTALDADGNGTLTIDELSDAIEKAGLDGVASGLKDVMSSIGSEGFNKVNYTEFLAAALDEKVYTDTNELWSAFRIFDKDGDGGIDLEELKKMLNDGGGEISEEASTAAQKLIAEADRNGDSKINFDEFAEMMRA